MFEGYEAERLNFLQKLNADWLPYIHGETNMTDQQKQTVQLTSDAEPTAAKKSQSVLRVSQRTVENIIQTRTMIQRPPLINELKRQKNLRL